MTLREEYEERLAAWRRERSRMLSDRLTRSRKEAQMHEADVEQDDSVAEYFADRTTEMAYRVAADEARMATLAADAEEMRIAMVTEELDATIAAYNEALRTMAEQLATLDTQIAQVAALSQRAEELATTLPASAARQHQVADAMTVRTAEIGERMQALQDAVTLMG
ncbi:MAG: hypothetical protein M3Y58_01545 [Chloroflexota bacterium]|nr:hypothetical protein [Chloroflexota bacterium]